MNPALALFEAGLLRAKNTLSVVTQIWSGVIMLTCLWAVVGYSLVFSGTNAFIGDFQKAFFFGVSYTECPPNTSSPIPEAGFAVFMNMFAVITPLLMTGAYAERFKFHASLLLSLFWEIFVYYPVARWLWNPLGWLAQMGALDFAGGIVIHTTAGASALLVVIMIGQRKDFDKHDGEFPPSNLPLAVVGAALLWLGWFGFNAGSALSSDRIGTAAVVNTHLAASASGLVWMFLSMLPERGKVTKHAQIARGKPSSVAVINGVIAGLAGVTPACGYIESGPALILGIVLGFSSFASAHFLKRKMRIDDALDVSSVHGLTGLIGGLAIGLFATKSIDPTIKHEGWFYGDNSPKLLGLQFLAVGIATVWSLFWTYLLMLGLRRTTKWRFSEESERNGLDWRDLHERAYNDLFDGKGVHLASPSGWDPSEDPQSPRIWPASPASDEQTTQYASSKAPLLRPITPSTNQNQ
jgi:Amt family ammonium transporter